MSSESRVAIGTARISETGAVSDVRLADNDLNPRCAQTVERVIARSRYIPAHVDGAPRPALYAEIFYTP